MLVSQRHAHLWPRMAVFGLNLLMVSPIRFAELL